MWGRGPRGNSTACSASVWLSVTSSTTHKQILGSPGVDSQVGGVVYLLGPCGSLQWTLLWGWAFLPLPQPPQVFSVRGFEALSPPCWNPGLCSLSHSPVVPPGLSAGKCGTACSASCHLASSPLLPGYPSLPLLPVWVNVSSLTPWLSGFHIVQFSGSSGCLCF